MESLTIPDTIYLVDLENVGTKVLYQHIKHNEDAEYIVFCSDSTSTPGSILEHVPSMLHITFIDCQTGGNNAMDFCICATAGRLSVEAGKTIKILSDDKGYDPMLYILHRQGVRISRENTAYQPESVIDPPENNQQWRENIPIIKAIREHVPKQYQQEMIAVLPGAINKKEAHEMLQIILPQKMVADIYKKLKKYIPKEVVD